MRIGVVAQFPTERERRGEVGNGVVVEKIAVAKLHEYIANTEVIEEKEVQSFLYSIINDPALTKKENMAKQMRFFKVFYNVLFGQDTGPRLYLFLSAVDKNKYLPLLDF